MGEELLIDISNFQWNSGEWDDMFDLSHYSSGSENDK